MFTFITQLVFISSVALAQQENFDVDVDGQMKITVPDEYSEISFGEIDEQVIKDWATGKETDMALLGQEFADAWAAYKEKVAQPWNEFLSQAELLSIKGAKMDLKSDEEIINFVAENTYLDGKSLKEVFPQVEDYLASLRQQGEKMDFNFDAFRITPRNLQSLVGGWLDDEGVYHPNEFMENTDFKNLQENTDLDDLLGGWLDAEGNFHPNEYMENMDLGDMLGGWLDEDGNFHPNEYMENMDLDEILGGWLDAEGNYHPNEIIQNTDLDHYMLGGWLDAEGHFHPNEYMENMDLDELLDSLSENNENKAFDKIRKGLIEFGYDPEITKVWFENQGTSFEDLLRSKDEETVAQAKADIAESADQVKGLLDSIIGGIRDRKDRKSIMLADLVNIRMNALKAEIDGMAQDAIDNLSNGILDIQSKASSSQKEIKLANLDTSTFEKTDDSTSTFKYGALASVSAVALIAYLYSQRDNKICRKSAEAREPFLNKDMEEYVQV